MDMQVVHLYETYIKVYGGVFFMLLKEALRSLFLIVRLLICLRYTIILTTLMQGISV